jgi:uncharacterized membrane protein YeaQ/YmgE (transglycosylase-associated protein family)
MFDAPGLDMTWLGWIVVGLIAGILSGAVVRGRTARGCLGNIVVGIIGGWVGGFIATEFLNFDRVTGFIAAVLVAFVGAVIVRFILEAISGRNAP